jgi:phage terminase large subunit-like protein
MKQLDAMVRAGRWHHDGNPVMEWMFSNVLAHYDHKDNIFPNKQKPENKIDGPVAAIMALSRAMVEPDPPKPFKPFIA